MRRALPVVGAGFLLGVGWGVLARLYMRLVATQPSFSWSGTLFILGVAGALGALLGVVTAARRAGRSRWWRLAAVPGLLLFAGPGMPLLPAFVVGGWAVATRRPMPLRAVAALVVLAVPVVLWLTMSHLDRVGLSGGTLIGGFWVVSVPLALAGAVLCRPWPHRDGGNGVVASNGVREAVVA